MPYIKAKDREQYEWAIAAIAAHLKSSTNVSGDLNYVISAIADRLIERKPNYQKINSIIGVLECAKMELYRRIASPYEDFKRRTNGDVYGNSNG